MISSITANQDAIIKLLKYMTDNNTTQFSSLQKQKSEVDEWQALNGG